MEQTENLGGHVPPVPTPMLQTDVQIKFSIASSPGYSQILFHSRGEIKSGSGLGMRLSSPLHDLELCTRAALASSCKLIVLMSLRLIVSCQESALPHQCWRRLPTLDNPRPTVQLRGSRHILGVHTPHTKQLLHVVSCFYIHSKYEYEARQKREEQKLQCFWAKLNKFCSKLHVQVTQQACTMQEGAR